MGFHLHSFLIEVGFVILFIIISIYLYALYKYKHWKRNNITQIDPKFPFGDCKDIIVAKNSIGVHFAEMYNEYKNKNLPFIGYYFMIRPELLIIDVDLIKRIMIQDFQHFTDRGTFNDDKNDPLTGHLFSIDGAKWRNLRTKLTPTFTSGKMKMMFHTLVACSDELNNILEEKERIGEPLDIKDYLARFTADVISSCAFGIDSNCLRTPNTEFMKHGTNVFEPKGFDFIRNLGGFLMPDIYKMFKIRALSTELSNFFIGVVRDTVKYREENNVRRKDFLQLLIELKNKGFVSHTDLTDDEVTDNENNPKNERNEVVNTSKGLTIEQMAAQCFVFFLAGFETSSTTMTFCLYELVKNPKIQEDLRNEINTVLKKHGGKLTYEAIMDMHFMEQVVNETLRKYPPLPFLIRKCTKDYKLPNSDYVIKKDSIIRISVLGLHRDPEYYPDPMKFDPNRFTEEEKAKRPKIHFIPFGEGPRICIGLRFGMMQTKVGLTVLLKNYRFTLNDKTAEPLVMEPRGLTMSTKDGIWLDAHKVVS